MLQVPTLVRVGSGAAPWRLYLLILTSHKTVTWGPSFGPRDCCSLPLREASTAILFASSASRPTSSAPAPTATWQENAQKGEHQRLFDDVALDAFPKDFEQYEEHPAESPWDVEWTHNCLLPPVVRKNQLEVTYGQRQPALQGPLFGIKITRSGPFRGAT